MAPPRRVAISLGDPGGVGPEIALKAALDPRVLSVCRPLLVGQASALAAHAAACGLDPRIHRYRNAADIAWEADGVKLLAPDEDEAPALGEIRAAHGRATLAAARVAIAAALAGQVDAVVAAPQNETAIGQAGIAFDGYPSFVASCTGVAAEDAFLMLCFDAMRIAHVTLHCALTQAIALVTRARVLRAIAATHETVARMGIASPRLAVAGLNPHAGENGLFGDEELRIIGPAIADAQAKGIRVEGPFGADTMLQRAGIDGFVVMIHDHGHIAAKLLAPNRAAAMTIGTPVLFSSVAHGSALDIAGQNRASPEAIVEAVQRLVGTPTRRAA